MTADPDRAKHPSGRAIPPLSFDVSVERSRNRGQVTYLLNVVESKSYPNCTGSSSDGTGTGYWSACRVPTRFFRPSCFFSTLRAHRVLTTFVQTSMVHQRGCCGAEQLVGWLSTVRSVGKVGPPPATSIGISTASRRLISRFTKPLSAHHWTVVSEIRVNRSGERRQAGPSILRIASTLP